MICHYLLCDSDGRVLRVETIECADDDAARVLASRMLARERAYAVEVWSGGRLIHRVSEASGAP